MLKIYIEYFQIQKAKYQTFIGFQINLDWSLQI